jgi:hypothetical protein
MFGPGQLLEALSSAFIFGNSNAEAFALASSAQAEGIEHCASSGHAYTSDEALINSPEDTARMLDDVFAETITQTSSLELKNDCSNSTAAKTSYADIAAGELRSLVALHAEDSDLLSVTYDCDGNAFVRLPKKWSCLATQLPALQVYPSHFDVNINCKLASFISYIYTTSV